MHPVSRVESSVDQQPLRLGGDFSAAGVHISLRTDSISVLCAAEEIFGPANDGNEAPALSLSVRTDASVRSLPPWPKPEFRIDGARFHVSFGAGNAMVMDLNSRTATASISPAMSHDVVYWKQMLLPAFFGTMCYTAGVCVLHCACVERDGKGILLAAPSGTGKSTLTYALAKRGFTYLSDDWTYLYRRGGRLIACALPLPVKLLDDCARWFPELSSRQPGMTFNGELAYEIDPSDAGIARAESCEPELLLFLERGQRVGFRPVSAEQAAKRFQQDFLNLPECFTGYDRILSAAAEDLAARGAFHYEFAGDPNETAADLALALGRVSTGDFGRLSAEVSL